MQIAIVTGSSGLIGSESVKFLHEKGFKVVGIDNNLRKYFFGEDGSTEKTKIELESRLENFDHQSIDIRDLEALEKIWNQYKSDIKVVVHSAAQPSHDWAAKEPITDFSVNATGTLNLLELCRQYSPKASFIFTSTNKVYGDTPNHLPLVETDTRYEVDKNHEFYSHGIDETMSIDQSKHSVFGSSKVAADVMVQEYGRYFGMNTVCFRGGCLTGPAHAGAELHGFLAYLVKCVVQGKKYTVFGYKGKQVRDNIHSHDLVNAFWHYHLDPKPGAVYNMGGSRVSNCSVLEAIAKIEEKVGKKLDYTISDEARSGDHIWYISDVRKFKNDYPEWTYKYSLDHILDEIIAATEQSLFKETPPPEARI